MREFVTITGVYQGRVRRMDGEGRPTAIYKQPVQQAVALGDGGLVDDQQGDHKAHGGAERALSHYPAEHYGVWTSVYPEAASLLRPGVFGENISTSGLTEGSVAVGDVFRMGTAVVQVSQPRQPCWKISHRLNLPELAREVAETGRSGWLYRVLEPGYLGPGDVAERLDRATHGYSLADMWAMHNARRPAMDDLEALATLDVLADSWRQRFASRLDWMRRHA